MKIIKFVFFLLLVSKAVFADEVLKPGESIDFFKETGFHVRVLTTNEGAPVVFLPSGSQFVGQPGDQVLFVKTQSPKGVEYSVKVSGYRGEFSFEENLPLKGPLNSNPRSRASTPAKNDTRPRSLSLSATAPSKPRLEGMPLDNNILTLHSDPFFSSPGWQAGSTVAAGIAVGILGSNLFNQSVQQRIQQRGFDEAMQKLEERIKQAQARVNSEQRTPRSEIQKENFQYLQGILEAAKTSRWPSLNRMVPPTPMPDGISKQGQDRLRATLDSPWEAKYREGSWVQTAEAVNGVETKIDALRELGENGEANYLQQELAREYVNSQGVLKGLVFAKAPEASLMTDRYSPEGRQIRSSLNRLLGSEESLGVGCASLVGSNESVRDSCREIGSAIQGLKDAHIFSDRLAVDGQMDSFQLVMSGLDQTVRDLSSFVSGFGTGVAESTVHAVEGLIQTGKLLVTNPTALVNGLVEVISNASFEKIQNYVVNSFEEILTADAETLGQKMGSLAFEAATFLGPAAISKAGKASQLLVNSVTRLSVKESLGLFARKAVLAGTLTEGAATGITKLATKAPYVGRALFEGEKAVLSKSSIALAEKVSTDSGLLKVISAADRTGVSAQTVRTVEKAYEIAPQPLTKLAETRAHEVSKYSNLINESSSIKVGHPSGSFVTQEMSLEALEVRASIEEGSRSVYRVGNYGQSRTTVPRIDPIETPRTWAPENPLTTPNFTDKYGIYSEGRDFIEVGEIRQGGTYVTRRAGPGTVELKDGSTVVTKGGGVEAVVEPGSVVNIRHYGQ